jgi:hypothetical protein
VIVGVIITATILSSLLLLTTSNWRGLLNHSVV